MYVRERTAEESKKKEAAAQKKQDEIFEKQRKERQKKKAEKKALMGEDYVSSGDEKYKIKAPAVYEEPDGEATDPSSMLYKYNLYLKQVKKYEEDNALSDDEVVQLDIKTKI